VENFKDVSLLTMVHVSQEKPTIWHSSDVGKLQ